MSAPTQAQLCRLHVHSVVNQLETKEGSTGIIFGTAQDLINQNLAHNIKKINVDLAFDTVHCLDLWMGQRAWIDKVFSEEKTLNTHCIRLIQGAIKEKSNRDRDLELQDYRKLDDSAIFKLWNSLHPQNSKTFPRHTWRNNVGDVDAAGNPVILDPPAIERTSYVIPFAPVGFDIHVAETWEALNDVDFERATVMNGFYPHFLRTRGFIFAEATRNAAYPFRKLTALTIASTTVAILEAARELNVYNAAFEQTQRDRSDHSKRLKDDEAKKKIMRTLTDRIFGPTHQQAIAPFKQTSDYNGIRLYFDTKFGAMTDSTVVIDEIRKAFTTPSTYSKCTSVADSVNTWEMLSIIYISLEHNHRGTAAADLPADIHAIRASIYKDSVDYAADYPTTPRIVSYADSRAYFLFPFELSRFSSIVRRYKTDQLIKTITEIKAVLEREEDADHKDPQRAYSSAAPRAFMVNATSEHGDDEFLTGTSQYTNRSSSLNPYSHPSHPNPYPDNLPSSEPFTTEEEVGWDTHALAVFAENSAAILYVKPCPICKLLGKVRYPEERAKAEHHNLHDCPILPKIVAAMPANPNHQGYPRHDQAGLPPYPSILAKIQSAKSSGVKREHSSQTKPAFSKDSVKDQMIKRLYNPSRAHLAVTSNESALSSYFVPAGNETKEDLHEEGFLDPNA